MNKKDWQDVGKVMLIVTYWAICGTGFIASLGNLCVVLFAAVGLWITMPVGIIVGAFWFLMISIGGIVMKEKLFP